MTAQFRKFAQLVSHWAGSPAAFAVATIIVLVWGCLGPTFHYSDTWQLVINTGTTIVTFLMVFLIQNTQNRDGRAIHLKLDELIRANSHARNHMIDLQSLSDAELDKIHEDLCRMNQEMESKIDEVQKVKKSKSERRR